MRCDVRCPCLTRFFLSDRFSLSNCAFQSITLNASASVDADDIHLLPFTFSWMCIDDDDGDVCVSPTRTALDVSSFAENEVLSIPAGSLPIGTSC